MSEGRKRKRGFMAAARGGGAGAEPPALPGLAEPPQLSVRFLGQLGPRVPENLEAGEAQTLGFTTKPDPSAPAQSLKVGTGAVSVMNEICNSEVSF